MKYTVIWSPAAEAELADLWIKAKDRNVIAEAADEIDDLLRRDPREVGESRDDRVRVVVVSPLGVEFEVKEADLMVYVLAVWRFRVGKRG
jgi:hypothetical protein